MSRPEQITSFVVSQARAPNCPISRCEVKRYDFVSDSSELRRVTAGTNPRGGYHSLIDNFMDLRLCPLYSGSLIEGLEWVVVMARKSFIEIERQERYQIRG